MKSRVCLTKRFSGIVVDGTVRRNVRLLHHIISLRMYCIDTGAIPFMFDGGSSCASTIHPIDPRIGLEYLCY